MPQLDRDMQVIREWKMKMLEEGIEKVIVRPQEEKVKTKTIKDKRGKSKYIDSLGLETIKIYCEKP